MSTLAIAISPECRAALERAGLTDESIGDEFAELVAGVFTTVSGHPFSGGKGVTTLPVFTESGQRVGLSLVVMISRSSEVYGCYPVIEEGIRDACLHYLDHKGVDFTFTSRVVVIDGRY